MENRLFGDSQEKGHQVGADLLPSERYLRSGARPPVLQASWGVSICFGRDKGTISPEIGEVKLFSMVTRGLGLLLRKRQGTTGGGRKDGSIQSPGHRAGEDRNPQFPCDYEGIVTHRTLWFLVSL